MSTGLQRTQPPPHQENRPGAGSVSPALAAAYRAAETVARNRARNFYYSFVVLPPEKRRALCAVYTFMRHCDDISDGSGSVEDKRQLLGRWRRRLETALRGDTGDELILSAFQDTVHRFSIPGEYFHRIIDGAEMDLTIQRYETFEQLRGYCFNVASSVGLVCLRIFGYKGEEAAQHAEDCGIAFQITNILRDIEEDATLGRIYLPREDMSRFRYSPDDLLRGVRDERFHRLMVFEAERAERYYAAGRQLLPLVDKVSRPALWAMVEIYHRLLRRIVHSGFDVFGRRIRVPHGEKAGIVARALVMRFLAFRREA